MALISVHHRLSELLVLACAVVFIGSSSMAAEYDGHYRLYKAALSSHDMEAAVVHARRAYLASSSERGAADIQTGVLAYNLGAVNYELGRYRDAISALEKALPIYEASYGQDNERVATPLAKLAAAHQALEEWQSAEQNYVRATQILSNARGPKDPQVGAILGQLSQVAGGLGEPKRVRSYGLRALAIIDHGDPLDPLAAGNLHINVAGAEMSLGHLRQARQHTERAIDLYEGVFQATDPELLRVYEFAADVYELTGKEATAKKYRRRIRKAAEKDS